MPCPRWVTVQRKGPHQVSLPSSQSLLCPGKSNEHTLTPAFLVGYLGRGHQRLYQGPFCSQCKSSHHVQSNFLQPLHICHHSHAYVLLYMEDAHYTFTISVTGLCHRPLPFPVCIWLTTNTLLCLGKRGHLFFVHRSPQTWARSCSTFPPQPVSSSTQPL